MKDNHIILICIGIIAITCIGAFAFLNMDTAQNETNSNITSVNNTTNTTSNNVTNLSANTDNQKSSSDNSNSGSSVSQKPKTFGVCISCGKVVPGAYGRIRCAECQRALETGEPFPDHHEEADAVTNPNGVVGGDGDHSDIYNNYEY